MGHVPGLVVAWWERCRVGRHDGWHTANPSGKGGWNQGKRSGRGETSRSLCPIRALLIECVFRRRLQVPRDARRALPRLLVHDDLLEPGGERHALQQIRSCPPHMRLLKSRRPRLCRPPLLHSPANPRDPSTSAGGKTRRRSGNRGDGALSNLHGLGSPWTSIEACPAARERSQVKAIGCVYQPCAVV